jgi:rSAM/selenodomain-associated transferase 1
LNHLGLFAKFWQPGSVKTRLAATIGKFAACDVYQAFLIHLLARHCDSADMRTVVFSPRERESQFRASIPSDWNFEPQSVGNLGQRMQSFFEQQFGRRHAFHGDPGEQPTKIVVIGADCPQLNPTIVRSAFDALDDKEVIIGPSTDGGYYLIGMREKCFPIFADVSWSTPRVQGQTIEHLENHQIKYGMLSPLTDVDEVEDLMEFLAEFKRRSMLGALDSLDLELYRQVRDAVGYGTKVEPE